MRWEKTELCCLSCWGPGCGCWSASCGGAEAHEIHFVKTSGTDQYPLLRPSSPVRHIPPEAPDSLPQDSPVNAITANSAALVVGVGAVCVVADCVVVVVVLGRIQRIRFLRTSG